MHLMPILRKPSILLWRFAEWRRFHRRYGLAQVVVFISTGRSQFRWAWTSGKFTLSGSSELPKFSVFKLTRHVQLTLVRSYVYRAHIITEPDGLSKQVRK